MGYIKAFFMTIYEYFKGILLAILGKNINKWNVFLLGHLGVSQIDFLPGMFIPKERVFFKAERTKDWVEGTVNDVYNQIKVDHKNRIALYIKEGIDS